MKVVLTLDYSRSAYDSIAYVLSLLSPIQDEVSYTLVHSFKPSAPYMDVSSIPVIQNKAWFKDSQAKLEQEAEKLRNENGINVNTQIQLGPLGDSIVEMEESIDPDLIVMASREKSLLERLAFGSNTLQVISKVSTPVLVIPLGTRLDHRWENITLASDLKPLSISKKSMDTVKSILKIDDPRLEVLHVYDSKNDLEENKSITETTLHQNLKGLDHVHTPVVSSNGVYEGINKHLEAKNPDLLILRPREKNFLEKLFQSSITYKMTYYAVNPILVLK